MLPQVGRFYAFAKSKSTRQSSEGDKTISIINTGGVDRHGTIIEPGGMDVAAYRENPIFLLNHDHDQVGGTSSVVLEKGKWQSEVSDEQWSKRQSAQEWKQDVKDGIVRMTSVGIIPRCVEEREVKRDGKETEKIPVIEKSELMEWSFVAVGSNPEALIQQRNMADDFLSKLEELHKQIDKVLNREIKISDSQIDMMADAIIAATEPQVTATRKPQPTATEWTPDRIARIVSTTINQRLGKA